MLMAPLPGHGLYVNFMISNVLTKIMYVTNAVYAKTCGHLLFFVIAHKVLAPLNKNQQRECPYIRIIFCSPLRDDASSGITFR